MYTVTITSLKGGSGKTTLAAAIAVELERLGCGPVALIGTDPQGSLGEWWSARKTDTPRFVWINATQLLAYLEFLPREGINLVILDTPPALEPVIRSALAVCDLAIVPVRPSPSDLRAVDAIIEVIEQAGKDFLLVLNAATPRTNIARDTLQILAQRGKVAPVTLSNRVDFAVSMFDGRTAGELKRTSKSASEVTELAQYVYTQLKQQGEWTRSFNHQAE